MAAGWTGQNEVSGSIPLRCKHLVTDSLVHLFPAHNVCVVSKGAESFTAHVQDRCKGAESFTAHNQDRCRSIPRRLPSSCSCRQSCATPRTGTNTLRAAEAGDSVRAEGHQWDTRPAHALSVGVATVRSRAQPGTSVPPPVRTVSGFLHSGFSPKHAPPTRKNHHRHSRSSRLRLFAKPAAAQKTEITVVTGPL